MRSIFLVAIATAALHTAQIAIVAILTIAPAVPGLAQACNPAIDGTYCTTPINRNMSGSAASSSFTPMSNLGGDLSPNLDQPATLGAITFRGSGRRCIGLLGRGNCS
jgi:hypothetical protein